MTAKQIVLVTGGNQGIGYQICKQLCLQHRDYHVVVGSRDLARGEAAAQNINSDQAGLSISALQVDVTDGASITAAAKTVEETWGRLDVLVNNAGIWLDCQLSPSYPFASLLRDTLETNVIVAAAMTEAFIPFLSKAPLPRIVFVSSGAGSLTAAGKKATRRAYLAPAYSASKAALNMLMLQYANRFEEQGWKVNACCPGFRSTGFTKFDQEGGPVEEGAIRAVELATLTSHGESGTFSNKDGPRPW